MTNIEVIMGAILTIISVIVLVRLLKGRSCDYKTRIRTYCAVYNKEICFVDTVRKNVVQYIEDTVKEYDYKKKDFVIKIKYMSKLTYSLMREV